MKKLLLISVLLLVPTSAGAIECKTKPEVSGSRYWAWRIIDGKKCWYQGERRIAKSKLHWTPDDPPIIARRSMPPADRSRPALPPVPPITAPPPAETEVAIAAPKPVPIARYVTIATKDHVAEAAPVVPFTPFAPKRDNKLLAVMIGATGLTLGLAVLLSNRRRRRTL